MEGSRDPRQGHPRAWIGLFVIVWIGVVGTLAVLLHQSQADSRAGIAWIALGCLGLAGLIITALASRLIASRRRLAQLNGELSRLARVDTLTGLKNRREIEHTLLAAVSTGRRHGLGFAILLIDIDHFKRINDKLGHIAGDGVLSDVAGALRGAVRTEDSIGRWGGEEFLAILPMTDGDGAVAAGERLREAVAVRRHGESADRAVAVTITIGAAVWWAGEGMDELVSKADAALYAGKATGRNTVRISSPGVGHVEPTLG